MYDPWYQGMARTSLEVTDEGFRLVQTIVNYTQRSYKQIVFGAKDHPRHPMDELLHPFGHMDKADRVLEPTDIDGIRIDFPSWWFNLRTSNTEPLLRLVVEARTPAELSARIHEVTGRMEQYANGPLTRHA
mgnify:CR=1 FL=1